MGPDLRVMDQYATLTLFRTRWFRSPDFMASLAFKGKIGSLSKDLVITAAILCGLGLGVDGAKNMPFSLIWRHETHAFVSVLETGAHSCASSSLN